MDEQVLKYREAKIMEPIYRMFKVIEQEDVLKAQTFMSVTMQYIIENFKGQVLRPAEVQNILRAVLLQEPDGKYYAMYANNEIQVKAAEWFTLLSVDLPITLEQLGFMADSLAEKLSVQDFIALQSSDVIMMMKEIASSVDDVLSERITLNAMVYLTELQTFMVQ